MALNLAYIGSPDAATSTFGLASPSLYRNFPKLPFEYYIQINLENTGVAQDYFQKYFLSSEFEQIQPLVKTIDMPSMKIDTVSMNQYNRKRIAQNKISFEPIKAVFHDVADGKTLAFWQMYYNYYFRDGLEAGDNSPQVSGDSAIPYNDQSTLSNGEVFLDKFLQPIAGTISPVSNNGMKQALNDVLSDEIENHNFGLNSLNYDGTWPSDWEKQKYLIQTIEIFQVHGGNFNQVTLVNPRISAFTHDVLNYAAGDKTLELTFTFEYEYAYYNTDNQSLDDDQLDVFANNFLELGDRQFNVTSKPYSIETNPQLAARIPGIPVIAGQTGNNLQASTAAVVGSQYKRGNSQLDNLFSIGNIPGNRILTSTSSLSGVLNIRPLPIKTLLNPKANIRSFLHTKENLVKSIFFTGVKGIVQGGVNQGLDFVTANANAGISGVKAYIPVELSSPISKIFGGGPTGG